MSKENEISFLGKIGDDGRAYALDKPYSDPACGSYIADIGSIMSLLPQPPGLLLDLGVGTGWTSIFFAQRGYTVTGQDIAADMIAFAERNKQRACLKNLEFITSDFEDLSFNEVFDCAVVYSSLHHATDPQAAVNAVYRALKKGGMFVALEPGIGHAKSTEAREFVKKWGVTEKDMPPCLIQKMGKIAGFSGSKVFLHQSPTPLEILPYLPLRRLVDIAKVVLRFLPVMGRLRSNITVLYK